MRMTLADVSYDRSVPGRSVGLFLTDRCPVGCAHCSVDSRPDSPTLSNYKLFEETVGALAERSHLRSIGITGGEPFVERRGLTLAVDKLSAAGKCIVLFTSGVWAKRSVIPSWIRQTIRQTSCIFLSTDAFHSQTVNDEAFSRAVRCISNEGVWLVVQVLERDVDITIEQLEHALGGNWSDFAELSRISPLPYGRGSSLFSFDEMWAADRFDYCRLAVTPLIRYDGVVTACCNEEVIMGKGSNRLRRKCKTSLEVIDAVDGFIQDPLMLILGNIGAGSIVSHPRYAHLKEEKFTSICHLCWAMQDATPDHEDDVIMRAASVVGRLGGVMV